KAGIVAVDPADARAHQHRLRRPEPGDVRPATEERKEGPTMTFAEVSVWALWVATVTLTLILYLRVKLHDWGMVGLTIFLFGASVLTTRAILRQYDLEYGGDSSLYAWRIFVLIGTPIAI